MWKRAEKAAIVWSFISHRWLVIYRWVGAPPSGHSNSIAAVAMSEDWDGWGTEGFTNWEEARDFAVWVTGA